MLHGCQWNPKGSTTVGSNVSRWKTETTLGRGGWMQVVGKDLDEGWDYWMKVGMLGIKFYQIITWLFFQGGMTFWGPKTI